MEEVIAGLIVAAVTGLTYIAYKHPRTYLLILPWLLGVLIIIFASLVIRDYYFDQGVLKMLPYLAEDKIDVAEKIMKNNHILPFYSYPLFPFVIFYFFFIRFLNKIK